jgi:hypothetical protein
MKSLYHQKPVQQPPYNPIATALKINNSEQFWIVKAKKKLLVLLTEITNS